MIVGRTNSKIAAQAKVLLHGFTGAGKTTSAKTLPAANTLVISADHHTLALSECDMPLIQVDDWLDFVGVVDMLDTAPQDGVGRLSVNVLGTIHPNISIVFLDGLAEVAAMCQRQIVEHDRKIIVAERSTEKEQNKRAEDRQNTPKGIYDDVFTQEDWGVFAKRMSTQLAKLMKVRAHIIVTCLTTWKEDKKTAVNIQAPAIQGQVGNALGSYFDLVLYMLSTTNTDGKNERFWQTVNDGQTIAKDGTGRHLSEYIATDWTALLKHLAAKPTPKPAQPAQPAPEQPMPTNAAIPEPEGIPS